MVYHVTILAGKMIENKASHDTQRVFHDLSRAVEYCHYYHKEKKTANKKTNKTKKGKKKIKIKKKKKKKGRPRPRPRPRPRVRVLLTPLLRVSTNDGTCKGHAFVYILSIFAGFLLTLLYVLIWSRNMVSPT